MTQKKSTKDLLVAAQNQLKEHQAWLKHTMKGLSIDKEIKDSIDEIRIASVSKETDTRTLSVLYSYPDSLYAYMTSDKATSELKTALVGAVDMGKEE